MIRAILRALVRSVLTEGGDLPAPRPAAAAPDTRDGVSYRVAELLPEALAVHVTLYAIREPAPSERVVLCDCWVMTVATGPHWQRVSRAQWDRLLAGGVPLLRWDVAERVRAAGPVIRVGVA
jgi:hypothetical protein